MDFIRNIIINIFLLPVRFYRKFISPLKPPSCRFFPSCSAYALEAFSIHGIIKGLILSVWRIIRCNPYNVGGIDYVPKKFRLVRFKGNCHEK